MNILEKLFGANWRTTTYGLLETAIGILLAISVLPAETWEDWRKSTIAVLLCVLKTIRDRNTKDAKVSGIGTAEDPLRKPSDDGQRSQMLPLLLAALIPAFIFTGCATTTGDPGRDRAGRVTNALLANAARHIGEFAMVSIQHAAAQAVNDRNVDWSSAASQGLWTSLPKIVSSDDVKRVIDAWAGPAAPAIIKAAGPEIEAASTPQQSQAVAVAIASGIDGQITGGAGK